MKKLLKNKPAKILAVIFAVFIILAATAYRLYLHNKSEIHKIYNYKDYCECQKIITSLPDTIIREPIDIPKEKNGVYWFKSAGLDYISESDIPVGFINNTVHPVSYILNDVNRKYFYSKTDKQTITFNDKNIVTAVKKFKPIEELLKKGTACDFFQIEYQGKKNPFVKIDPDSVKSICVFYRIKSICEINDGDYNKAAETINEALKLVMAATGNYAMNDRKIVTDSLFQISCILTLNDSLEYLLEKSDKPHPQLTKTIKKIKNSFSDEEIKKVFETDMFLKLIVYDMCQKNEKSRKIKNYDLADEVLEESHVVGLLNRQPVTIVMKPLICSCCKINTLNNYKFISKYIDTKNPQILEQIEKYNNNPKEQAYHSFSYFSNIDHKSSLERMQMMHHKLKELEKRLDSKK